MNPNLPTPTIVAILAGGKARRFGGQDKGEILINGERLVDIIHERLKSQSDKIIISGQHDYGLGVTVVPDANDAPGGPVGGIYSIWKNLENRNVEGFFTIAIDGPNLSNDVIARLYSKDNSCIAVDDTGRHPTYGWWRMTDLAVVWERVEGSSSLSLNYLAECVGARHVTWDGNKAFININRAIDLDRFVKEA